MKTFCYFVEPASYTLDLASNVYEKNNIDYCFIKSSTLALSTIKSDKFFLDKESMFSKIKFVYSQFKNNDFIIINGYNNYPFILTFIFNLFSFNKKYIASESDTQLSIPSNLLKRLVKWIYLSFIFRNKYVLGFAGGNNSHKELFRYYGMHNDRIFLMPMMVNNKRFTQEKKAFPEIFTFLFVGRIVEHKNVEELIKQFNKHMSNNVFLRIVGDGNQKEYLDKKYSSEKVIFTGKKFYEELLAEFQNASCFVCPSIFEPWGLVVNEALSSGLPVIATKEVGACYDLILNKETGFIAKDMGEFGELMLALYKDEKLLKTYSKNASRLMKEEWNYNLYNQCLNSAIKKVEKWR